MGKRPTIRDVAKLSGFSITTVSLVLNHKGTSIPQHTKDKVWQAANTLQYSPAKLAANFATAKSGVIGLILPDSGNCFFIHLCEIIEKAAQQAGYTVLYASSSQACPKDDEYFRLFTNYGVDGIIHACSEYQSELQRERIFALCKESGVPVVALNRLFENQPQYTVKVNDYKGGYLATKHLLDLGHTRIGCLTGSGSLSCSQSRLKGHLAALEMAGLTLNPSLVFEGNYQEQIGTEALEHFLRHKVTAICAFNDVMAMGLYRAARKKGLVFPRDLSVVGFDDIPMADLLHPPLTTIGQPVQEIGACAVELMISLIEGNVSPNKQKSYVFEPRFILRESTGPYQNKEEKL